MRASNYSTRQKRLVKLPLIALTIFTASCQTTRIEETERPSIDLRLFCDLWSVVRYSSRDTLGTRRLVVIENAERGETCAAPAAIEFDLKLACDLWSPIPEIAADTLETRRQVVIEAAERSAMCEPVNAR